MRLLADPILLVICVPLAAGLVTWAVPRRAAVAAKILAVLATLFCAVWTVTIWAAPGTVGVAAGGVTVPESGLTAHWAGRQLFSADRLSSFAAAAAGVLAFLVTLYAAGFSREGDAESPGFTRRLFSGMLLSVGATFGSLYAENLVALVVFWGFMGIPFFLLLNLGKEGAAAAAKKSFIIVGGTDSLLVLGIALVVLVTGGRLTFHGGERIATTGTLSAVAYACFLAAALAKAGAIPLHSWIPDAAATAPVPVVALLPASLDKVLGIYLLARVSLTLFRMSGYLSALVMVLGAVTVVAAVFMALVQHDLRRLLGFHAVSQVGYMILGIGTGTFVGVVGGLFHMLNHAIYKSCLFLTAGSAERKAGTGDLGEMGGLARLLPVTFISATVAALAISGVPPLNGFVSKWMVYQGLVELGRRGGPGGGYLWVLLLACATFGSALTLASFVKVVYSVYLGRPPEGKAEYDGPGENVLTMVPMAALALACVAFGVAAFRWPLRYAVVPAAEAAGVRETRLMGFWEPGLATVLILVGIACGAVVYLIGRSTKPREASSFVGGEVTPDLHFGGPDFYETITRIPPLTSMYPRAAKGLYDVYRWGRGLADYAGKGLRALHSGVLYQYVTWTLVGVVILLWLFLR